MATKEEDFKQRFIAVMRDLDENGKSDREAMYIVGSMASGLMDFYKAKTWMAFKKALTRPAYDRLLKDLEEQGNTHHRERRVRAAYAVQLIAMSVVAATQKDKDVQAGDKLLNQFIDTAAGVYQRLMATQQANKAN